MVGGGAGAAPSTVTTGTGVVTALGVNTGTAGAFVVNGGALGTPSSGTVTNLTGTASININGTVGATTANTGAFTTIVGTTTSATGFAVGRQGTTNPVLNVDASTASVVTGLNLKGAAAAGGMALSVTSSGTNENLTIDAKGSGTVTINGTATGGITLTRATTMSSTATATAFIPSGSSVPTNGMYLPSADLVSISSASTRVARFFYSSGANWGAFGGFAFVAGNANGSYPVGGYGCRPAGTANTYTYDQSDYAAFIQYGNGGKLDTYTAASGTVGNTISPTAGPYLANLGTSWTNSSDARLKDQFTALSGVLDKLANIVVGTYVWSGQGQSPAGRADLGIRAQELHAQFPLLVDKGDDSPTWDSETSQRWGINESKVGVVALQAVKELLDEVRALADRISALENR
jgi:hypothetical protein